VRPGTSTGAYTTLTPRQALTPAPYALALSGLWTQQNATSPNLIGGYSGNSVTAGVVGATIGGGGASGSTNRVTNNYATVGGGITNIASGLGATVGGGNDNTSSKSYATIGGGQSNSASGQWATVPGGLRNTAQGNYSFAAGYRAKANHQGAFVWADSTDADFASTANDQFAVRANGGVVFSTGGASFRIDGGDAWTSANDGSGSGLDADMLDGQDGSYYLDWNNLTNVPAGFADGVDNTGAGGDFWSLTGNAGTNPSTNFLGTTNNQVLELRVNNARALRLEPNAESPNLIGGFSGNSVTVGVVGATIGGGGASGSTNRVTDNYGTVDGGVENRAGNANGDLTDGSYATVGGGYDNIASSYAATVGGGYDNTASGYAATVGGGHLITVTGGYATAGGGLSNTASGLYALVAGGGDNTASGQAATVGGGYGNVASGVNATVGGGEHTSVTGQAATVAGGSYITATSDYAAIGGGQHHTASAPYATIGGGEFNTASGYDATVGGGNWNEGSGEGATVGGGDSNIADGGRATVGGGSVNTASGWAATVPGGYGNTAQGNNSFAAGNRAKAYHNGAFVWADSWTNTDFESQQAHQFRVRAWGGAQFNDGLGDWVELLWTLPIATSTGAWLSWDGIWWNASDVALKENFAPVDSREVLQKLANMPITTWNYRGKDVDTRHLGPTGQDFYAAFGLGDSDRAISTLDADGVALTAIQGLYELVQEKDGQIAVLEAEVSTLHQQNTDLEARVAALEQAVGASPSSPSNPPGGWWPLFLGGLVVAAGVMIQRRHPGGGR